MSLRRALKATTEGSGDYLALHCLALTCFTTARPAAVWALYNSIPAYLFLHYCCSTGRSFKWVALDWWPKTWTDK